VAGHLSQQRFAKLINVQIGTLRNWEQGVESLQGLLKRWFMPSARILSTLFVRY